MNCVFADMTDGEANQISLDTGTDNADERALILEERNILVLRVRRLKDKIERQADCITKLERSRLDLRAENTRVRKSLKEACGG